MEAILFIGLPASGKSTFYKQNFFNSHLRISNDLLKTKNREKKLLDFCVETQMKIVIDNTNVSREIRLQYIAFLKKNLYKITGYYFKTDLARSFQWNKMRSPNEIVPDVGILDRHKNLELPSLEEGYDDLYYVDFFENQLLIKSWDNEV